MRRNYFVIIIVVVVLAAIFFLFVWPKIKRGRDKNKINDKAKAEGKASISWRGDDLPLSLGSSGKRVGKVQEFLNKYRKASLKVDDLWGYGTESVVRAKLKNYPISETIYTKNILPSLAPSITKTEKPQIQKHFEEGGLAGL